MMDNQTDGAAGHRERQASTLIAGRLAAAADRAGAGGARRRRGRQGAVVSAARRTAALVPRVALLFLVGWSGKWIEGALKSYGKAHHTTLPNIEYVLWAILIGLAIGNLVG